MKRILSVVAIALVALTSVRATAQTQTMALPTIDQVLDKWIAALGGRDAIQKHTSRVSRGTIEMVDAPMPPGTVEVSEKAPDKALTVINLQGQLIREGADASGAWQQDPMDGVKDKTGKDLADAKRDATFNSELRMKEIFKTLTVMSQETVGGKPAYLVVGTPADGSPTRFWFAADTGLLIRTRSTRDTPQGPMDIDVFLEDYRDVDGVKTAHMIRQVTQAFTMLVKLSEIKFNVPLDDAIFRKPK